MLLDGGDVLAAAPTRATGAARIARIALVPQGAMSALNPVLSVATQFEDLFAAHGERGGQRAHRATAALRRARCGGRRRFPHQLSGGMKQRVCIALAIALQPAVIVADEPTSALDVMVQKQVLQTLIDAQREIGAAIVIVGHDMGLMAQFANRIGVMYAGKLVELNDVGPIFAAPRHPYTRLLIESLPGFRRARQLSRRSRRRALAPRPTIGLPLSSALPARRDALRDRSAGPRSRSGDAAFAACHFATEVAHAA